MDIKVTTKNDLSPSEFKTRVDKNSTSSAKRLPVGSGGR